MLFFVGLASFARNLLSSMDGLDNTVVGLVVYICILPVALYLGRLGKKAKASQTPRIFGATLGSVGFVTASLTSGAAWKGPVIAVLAAFIITFGIDRVSRRTEQCAEQADDTIG